MYAKYTIYEFYNFLLLIKGYLLRILGNYSPFEAEIWGIFDRIFLLLDKGYKRVCILFDNLKVVQALFNHEIENQDITVLKRTQCLMKGEGHWKIKYIPRDYNLATNKLAKLSLT